jgi:membrane protein implicated in regulation of membrane protease activity
MSIHKNALIMGILILASQILYLYFHLNLMGISLLVHRRIVAIIFFPVVAFLWVLAWSLYWTGEKNRSRKSVQSMDRGISIVTTMYEEALITSHS